MKRLHRAPSAGVGPRRLDEGVGAGGVHNISGDGMRCDAVEFGGGAVLEPTGVHLPDGSHVPRRLAVALTDVEVLGHCHFAHCGVEVGAGRHVLDRVFVHGLHGVAHRGDFFGDALSALDGVEVPGDQPARREVQHGVARFDVEDGVAVAVTADRHQVGHVTEQRTK